MKEYYSRETLFFNLVSEIAICLPKSSFFLSFNPYSLKPCRIFQTSPLLFLNLLWTIPSSLILQKSVLPPRNLTLSKSPRFAWMVTTFWDGFNQFGCISEDVERWATWRVKRRLLQWMIRTMLYKMLRIPWWWHGLWILWKKTLALITCAIQQHKSFGRM